MLVVQHLFLAAAAILVMVRFRDTVLFGGYCLKCGGHGGHRDNCPDKD